MAESLHKSSGTRGLPKSLNNGRTLAFDFLTASLLPYAFVWQKCSEFQMTFPLGSLGQCAQISFEASLGQVTEKLLKWLRSIDRDGRHAHTV